jgi:hypothetical protein
VKSLRDIQNENARLQLREVHAAFTNLLDTLAKLPLTRGIVWSRAEQGLVILADIADIPK